MPGGSSALVEEARIGRSSESYEMLRLASRRYQHLQCPHFTFLEQATAIDFVNFNDFGTILEITV
jgi:hypothetical protein